jgi:ADP-heptose:LPS heptosyltransferase
VISFLFKTTGIATASIDKGRKEKKELTAKENKKLVQLKTSFQRYAEVFNTLGLALSLDITRQPFPKQELPASALALFNAAKKNICIAPFAKHEEKMYPHAKMKSVVKKLWENKQYQVFLLGGGKDETAILNEWEKEFPGAISLAGKFSIKEELAIISNMDTMISMDSANMHLASLFGVPVISVWGATHPFAGFYGWAQPADNAVQIDLYCRPCSVFGNKPCYRGDHACMQLLPEEKIMEKVMNMVR